ncbi:hypothetical protein SI65_03961 [Aspergillus cristatus]|uniref:Uncharacterized protein n=1 Tax=Aspergillus cristatus TaxID=573508 RepID=A0A1E3BJ29_ASPCR|nr:hypothetical protein SI65_03961 [Aspergillus cristatus]
MAASSHPVVPENIHQQTVINESGRPPGPDPGSTTTSRGPTQTQRPLDPRNNIEDYNRVMLQYTQRRMSTFCDMDEGHGSPSGSSNSSNSSSRSSDASSSLSGDTAVSNPQKEAVDRLQF